MLGGIFRGCVAHPVKAVLINIIWNRTVSAEDNADLTGIVQDIPCRFLYLFSACVKPPMTGAPPNSFFASAMVVPSALTATL